MCAPQNYSADLLYRALAAAGITTDYMIRLVDPRIPPAQVIYLSCFAAHVSAFCIHKFFIWMQMCNGA